MRRGRGARRRFAGDLGCEVGGERRQIVFLLEIGRELHTRGRGTNGGETRGVWGAWGGGGWAAERRGAAGAVVVGALTFCSASYFGLSWGSRTGE